MRRCAPLDDATGFPPEEPPPVNEMPAPPPTATRTPVLPCARQPRAWRLLQAVRAWCVFGNAALLAWLLVSLLPGQRRRWRALHRLLRLALPMAGVRLRVHGRQPAAPCVLVCNHTSFFDVIALIAALPEPVAFVAKAELGRGRLLGAFLRRLGVRFVERFERRRAQRDWQQVAAAARDGTSPLFFPEGTFHPGPGLLAFRLGAFLCAVEAERPVVPLVLAGARAVLPAGSWMPRPGRVTLVIGEAITADPSLGKGQQAARLRDRARAEMLNISGDPDLCDRDELAALKAQRSRLEGKGEDVAPL